MSSLCVSLCLSLCKSLSLALSLSHSPLVSDFNKTLLHWIPSFPGHSRSQTPLPSIPILRFIAGTPEPRSALSWASSWFTVFLWQASHSCAGKSSANFTETISTRCASSNPHDSDYSRDFCVWDFVFWGGQGCCLGKWVLFSMLETDIRARHRLDKSWTPKLHPQPCMN